MSGVQAAARTARRLARWALSVPMFVKVFGVGVLVVLVFATLMVWYIHGHTARGLYQMLQPGLSESAVSRETHQLARSVVAGALISLLIAAAMAALLARFVTGPIRQLVAAANRIGAGDFQARAAVVCDDEIGQLALAFNRMAEHLDEYRRQVQDKERARLRLLERIVDAQEEERRHIARELHDQVGQSLMALLLAVQSACRSRSLPDHHCAHLEGKIRELSQEIHRLAWGMRPSILDDYGLESALERYLDEMARQTGLEIDYQPTSPATLGRLPDRLEVTLYRIVQEAITNVVRHAAASRVSVVVLRQRDEVTLLIEDDGRGFDPAAERETANGRLGLGGMHERAALFGGVCTVESEPGRGTTIRVKIPLCEEQPCLSAS